MFRRLIHKFLLFKKLMMVRRLVTTSIYYEIGKENIPFVTLNNGHLETEVLTGELLTYVDVLPSSKSVFLFLRFTAPFAFETWGTNISS